MNFYQHHIGDFNSATRHLTRVERSIYRDLIELYYDTEAPLTADFKRLSKKVMARSDEEIEALNDVLDEFFTLTGDVYTHVRCDDELAKVYKKSDKARASAEKRWEKQANAKQSQDSSNANAMRTHSEEDANGMLPITHNPLPNKKNNSDKSDQVVIADRVISDLNAKAGKSYRLIDSNRKLVIGRLKQGFTEADCLKVVSNRCSKWIGTAQEEYLRPKTLFSQENFEGYLNDNGGSHAQNRPTGNTGAPGRKPTPAERVEIARQAAYQRELAGQSSPVGAVEAHGGNVRPLLGEPAR